MFGGAGVVVMFGSAIIDFFVGDPGGVCFDFFVRGLGGVMFGDTDIDFFVGVPGGVRFDFFVRVSDGVRFDFFLSLGMRAGISVPYFFHCVGVSSTALSIGVVMSLTELSVYVLALDFCLRNLRLNRCDRTLFWGLAGLAV